MRHPARRFQSSLFSRYLAPRFLRHPGARFRGHLLFEASRCSLLWSSAPRFEEFCCQSLKMLPHPLSLWGIMGHSAWGPTDPDRDWGCQPTPQPSAQYSHLWGDSPTLRVESTKSAFCSCNERMGVNCSSCHSQLQSPDCWFASPCLAGEKAKESFYSRRRFGRRASEQSSNPESGSPERALGECNMRFTRALTHRRRLGRL